MATAARLVEPATDLIEVAQSNPVALLTNQEQFDQFYERVREEVTGVVADVSTPRGRDEIRSLAFKVTKTKTTLDKAAKQLTEEWRQKTNAVNATRKEMVTRLDQLADEVRRPLTEWEQAEDDRADRVAATMRRISEASIVTLDDTAATVEARGREVYAIDLTEDEFRESLDAAKAAKDQAVKTLVAARDRLKREEEERAELERLRAAEAERLAREEAERAERERAEREAAEAKAREEAAQREAERLEREKQEAAARAAEEARLAAEREAQRKFDEERARAEAAEAEARRLKEEQERREREAEAAAAKEAEEARRREVNRNHRAKIMGEAKAAIMTCGVEEAVAKAIVLAIVAGNIPHTKVTF